MKKKAVHSGVHKMRLLKRKQAKQRLRAEKVQARKQHRAPVSNARKHRSKMALQMANLFGAMEYPELTKLAERKNG